MESLAKTDNYYLIVGMGATGLSIARYLNNKGETFHFFDTRASSAIQSELLGEFPSASQYFEVLPEGVLENATEVYLSPGVPRDEPVVASAINQGKSVVGDIELFLREISKPVVGITGSNGKSTVTTLVGMAAEKAGKRCAVGGNIGVPALELLGEDADVYVLELSSFQLESIPSANLNVACNLNVSADHMDRYDSMSSYVMAKQRIFFGAHHVVYCLDDPSTQPPTSNSAKRYGFGISRGIEAQETQYTFVPENGWLLCEKEHLIHKNDIRVKGIHNVVNALALFAIADAAGIEREACNESLREFSGLPHRCEVVAQVNEVTFVNDSKGTNIGATVAAIKGLSPEYQRIVLIAGGDGKGADFSELGRCIDQNVAVLITIGADAAKISSQVGEGVECLHAESMEDAVSLSVDHAAPGDVVLLSPACASFDMFDSFEHRGSMFVDSVNARVAA